MPIQKFALKIATRLREQGADIWFDKSDIPTGNIWDLEIEKALKSCNSLLFISSIASVSSENALNEVYFALEQKKKIVPVKIDDCTIPFRIQRLQYIDLSVNYEEGFNALLKALDLTKQLKINQSTTRESTGKIKLVCLCKKKHYLIIESNDVVVSDIGCCNSFSYLAGSLPCKQPIFCFQGFYCPVNGVFDGSNTEQVKIRFFEWYYDCSFDDNIRPYLFF